MQKLVGTDCPVPIGLDNKTSNASLIFPSGMDDPRAFYPMEIWGNLHAKVNTTLAISPNHPCVKFDTISCGENKKANGYQLSFLKSSKLTYTLFARKHTIEKNVKIGDYVNEYQFSNSGSGVVDVTTTYYYDTRNENVYIGFAIKKSIYYIQFDYDTSLDKELIIAEIIETIKAML